MLRLLDTWREALHIVQPDTAIRWQRRGWRTDWRRKSKARNLGRPAMGWELVHVTKRLSRENPLWGAPRIVDELALLGRGVGETTVAMSTHALRDGRPRVRYDSGSVGR